MPINTQLVIIILVIEIEGEPFPIRNQDNNVQTETEPQAEQEIGNGMYDPHLPLATGNFALILSYFLLASSFFSKILFFGKSRCSDKIIALLNFIVNHVIILSGNALLELRVNPDINHLFHVLF